MAKRVPNGTLVEVTDRVPKLLSCYVGQQGKIVCYNDRWYWIHFSVVTVLHLRRREFKLAEITSSK